MKWLAAIAAISLAVLAVASQSLDQYEEYVCDELRKIESSIFSIDNICYFISEEKLSWMNALNFCTRNFMLLAELSTEDSFINVTGRIQEKKRYGQYWFGLNDVDDEGSYTYVGTGKPIAYTTDSSRIKVKKGTNNCIVVKVSAKRTFMKNKSCSRSRRFICGRSHCSCNDLAKITQHQEAQIIESDEYADTKEEPEVTIPNLPSSVPSTLEPLDANIPLTEEGVKRCLEVLNVKTRACGKLFKSSFYDDYITKHTELGMLSSSELNAMRRYQEKEVTLPEEQQQ